MEANISVTFEKGTKCSMVGGSFFMGNTLKTSCCVFFPNPEALDDFKEQVNKLYFEYPITKEPSHE